MLPIDFIWLEKVTKKQFFFAYTKIRIRVVPKVQMIYTDKYRYSENMTSVTIWFKPKMDSLKEKLHSRAVFVLTEPSTHKTHPRVATRAITN